MSKQTALAVGWRHRALLLELVRREISSRHAGSIGGRAWMLLHPLILLGMYTLVFGAIFKVKLPETLQSQNYIVFIAVVLWPWMAFQESLIKASTCIVSNAHLIRKIAFPHELLVIANVASVFVNHVIGYVVVLTVLAVLGYPLHWQGGVTALMVLVALFFASVGLGWVLAGLQVYVRDTEQVLGQLLTFLFYASPILYPISLVPEWLSTLMMLNPLAHGMEWLRNGWLGTEEVGQLVVIQRFAWSAALVFLIVMLGRRFFLKLSQHFEDAL